MTSAEGFLYPQTYEFDPGTTAAEALQAMNGQFSTEIQGLDLAAKAKALGRSPYEVLIIASLIQRETRFAGDRAKVARVVLNRLRAGMPLGIDSTTAYGLELEGKDPKTATYRENSPYNTRIRPGLPPTPITNPEADVIRAAVQPAAGNWMYFVNGDAAGHLFFTADADAFDAAAERCRANNWG